MDFWSEEICKIGHITVDTHLVEIEFDDYDAMFLQFRGKKPFSYSYYDDKEHCKGIIVNWKNKNGDIIPEKISWLCFWIMMDKCWDWGNKEEILHNDDRDPYSILDFKYHNVRLQFSDNMYINFDRIFNKVGKVYQKHNL